MVKISEDLECKPCKFKFPPARRFRLRSNDEKYKIQIYLDGICPNCQKDTLAWVGILPGGKIGNYYPIALKQAKKWVDRLDSDLICEKPVKINPAMHSKKRMKTVKGFKKEKNSGKWMPQIQAVR